MEQSEYLRATDRDCGCENANLAAGQLSFFLWHGTETVTATESPPTEPPNEADAIAARGLFLSVAFAYVPSGERASST